MTKDTGPHEESRRVYHWIHPKLKQQLFWRVTYRREQITKVASDLSIPYSNAKMIIKRFGRVDTGQGNRHNRKKMRQPQLKKIFTIERKKERGFAGKIQGEVYS